MDLWTTSGADEQIVDSSTRRFVQTSTPSYVPTSSMQSLRSRIRQWAQARRTRQITLAQARQRAQRGAAYLDEVDPGWHRRIDPAMLALDDGAYCVLGQLHGDFRRGLSRASVLHLSSAPRANLSPVRLGLLCVQGVPEAWQEQDYRHLDRAWREEIARRRPPRTAPRPPGVSAKAMVEKPWKGDLFAASSPSQ